MNSNCIYAIGETVYDIIFKGGKPLTGTPGGAMLNSSVSLGRIGLPVCFISEIGKDDIGNTIMDFLKANNINTKSVYRYSEGNTALALAFLDEKEDAHYTFYKNYPEERLKIKFPKINENDIVLFGSFFAISSDVRKPLVRFLKSAKNAGAIIIYDPNFRKPHKKDLPKLKGFISENIEFADIIRGSCFDFQLIFNTKNADDTFSKINESGKKVLIYTAGEKEVYFRSEQHSFTMAVPGINVVSTVGAGDNFNAGIIYSLRKLAIIKERLTGLKMEEWKAILDSGITLGTIVCESPYNYISAEFASKLKSR